MTATELSDSIASGATRTRVQRGPHLVSRFRRIRAALRMRLRYREDLKRLLKVGPHMLEDIGVTQDEAACELAKPFWED